MASISVREATLGRSSGATKAVRSAAKALGRLQARVPLTVRGLRIVLRSAPIVAPATNSESRQPGNQSAHSSSGQKHQHAMSMRAPQEGPPGNVGPGVVPLRQQNGWLQWLRQWLTAAAGAAWSAACRAVLWLLPALHSMPLRLLAGIAMQCVCALLSAVPVRLKDVQVTHQVNYARTA